MVHIVKNQTQETTVCSRGPRFALKPEQEAGRALFSDFWSLQVTVLKFYCCQI